MPMPANCQYINCMLSEAQLLLGGRNATYY
jgi:hypothetical protein